MHTIDEDLTKMLENAPKQLDAEERTNDTITNDTMKHFIFGYGSLICPQSRAITAPTLTSLAEPVEIRHLERWWSARATRESPPRDAPGCYKDRIEGWTPMGVRFRRGARCNGVLIHVDEEELNKFDVREAGYERHRIDVGDILPHVEAHELPDNEDGDDDHLRAIALARVQCSNCRIVLERGFEKRRLRSTTNKNFENHHENTHSVNNEDDDNSNIAVWVYIQSEDLPANRNFPIPQSYVDIIMRGCISISHEFAKKFLQSTNGWWNDGKSSKACDVDDKHAAMDHHHTWVNDRHDPMYVRADSSYSIENGEEIDKIIEEHHPDALKRRVVMPL
eukprot:CCRYP_015451-RA/>CCRYP_015451-RA protein AED:0.36 eAED:0.36 QI:0/-1/0/1/-1/1/1/0/334